MFTNFHFSLIFLLQVACADIVDENDCNNSLNGCTWIPISLLNEITDLYLLIHYLDYSINNCFS